MSKLRKRTILVGILVLIITPCITTEDFKTDDTTIDSSGSSKGGSNTKLAVALSEVNAQNNDSTQLSVDNAAEKDCLIGSCISDLSMEESVFEMDDFRTFFEKLKINYPISTDGCLDGISYWEDDFKIAKAFQGTQTEGQDCDPRPTTGELDKLCQAFKTVGECKKQRTNLICDEIDEERGKCIRSFRAPSLKGLTSLTNVDNFGCSNIYKIQADIPDKFLGQASFRKRCKLFPTSKSERCRVFTTAAKYKNKNDPNDDHTECVKPTHLYCDPIKEKCLCGKGHDEIRFQFNNADSKCYVRPTFDALDGFLCSPGTESKIGEVKYKYCRCLSNSTATFNSSDPDWWTCGATILRQPRYVMITSLIIYLGGIVFQLF